MAESIGPPESDQVHEHSNDLHADIHYIRGTSAWRLETTYNMLMDSGIIHG